MGPTMGRSGKYNEDNGNQTFFSVNAKETALSLMTSGFFPLRFPATNGSWSHGVSEAVRAQSEWRGG